MKIKIRGFKMCNEHLVSIVGTLSLVLFIILFVGTPDIHDSLIDRIAHKKCKETP